MAHYYFKVPPHLAKRMKIANKPEKLLKDGNFMACYSNMAMFGLEPWEAVEKAQSMGCLALQPREMIEEVKGEVIRPLPQPTDPKFFPPQKEEIPIVEEVSVTVEEESSNEGEKVVVSEFVVETDQEEESEEEEETPNEEGGE